MHGAMEVDGGLGALALATPEVDAGELPVLERLPSREDLRVVGERLLQVRQEGEMVFVGMVRLKP